MGTLFSRGLCACSQVSSQMENNRRTIDFFRWVFLGIQSDFGTDSNGFNEMFKPSWVSFFSFPPVFNSFKGLCDNDATWKFVLIIFNVQAPLAFLPFNNFQVFPESSASPLGWKISFRVDEEFTVKSEHLFLSLRALFNLQVQHRIHFFRFFSFSIFLPFSTHKFR